MRVQHTVRSTWSRVKKNFPTLLKYKSQSTRKHDLVPNQNDPTPKSNNADSQNSTNEKKNDMMPNQNDPMPKNTIEPTVQSTIEPEVQNILSNPNNPLKRCIIIDGCNVGFAHANHQNFSIEGMLIALDFFTGEGLSAIAVVPQRKATSNTNPQLLQLLSRQKRVLFAPFDNEYGTCRDTYDDKCILGLAVRFEGAVVSNDNFRDIIGMNTDWRHVIETRVIPFCFFKDMFIVPRDPYGPGNPSLEQILTKTPPINQLTTH